MEISTTTWRSINTDLCNLIHLNSKKRKEKKSLIAPAFFIILSISRLILCNVFVKCHHNTIRINKKRSNWIIICLVLERKIEEKKIGEMCLLHLF